MSSPHTCAHPKDPLSAWAVRDAGSPLRTYQRRAVAEILQVLGKSGGGEPARRACLVAPPGAGKTRCAIHVAASMQAFTEVRVPTTALVEQWTRAIERDIVSLEPGASPLPFRVATYAGLGSFEPGALVVLDEAHHLGGAWGREVRRRLDAGHRVLGLTATPPQGSAGWDLFLELVGQDPVVVAFPPLVRDGHLCPYRDLVWPELAEPGGDTDLARALDALERVARETPGLDDWVDRQLQEHLWELTEARFANNEGLLVALCRRRQARGLSLPNDLPPDPDLRQAPGLDDLALLLHEYRGDDAAVQHALRGAGFRQRGRKLVAVEDMALRTLTRSRARLRACVEILSRERRFRADGLRALVLIDRDATGKRLSAREVLRALVRDRRTDPLDPVLVTGGVLWVDDDLWPRVEQRFRTSFPQLAWRVEGGVHEVDVSGWKVAERVALATALLREGLTRCLVGTYHLLGEGWDCPAVNCLVDLTGVASSVTTNQVRGRALRIDPADPSKVASLWSPLVLLPNTPGGDRMLVKLKERYSHTLGIDDDGRVRKGIDRIHPDLGLDAPALLGRFDALRRDMELEAQDTVRTAKLWSCGRAYEDRIVWRIIGSPRWPPRRGRSPRPKAIAHQRPDPGSRLQLHSRGVRGIVAGGVLALAGPILAGSAVVVAGPAAVAAGGLAFLVGLGAMVAGIRKLRCLPAQRDAALAALAEAFGEVEPQAGPLRMDGDTAWMEGHPSANRRFAEAAAELFGRVRYPRYLLVERDGATWPVPSVLGVNRTAADTFARAWTAHLQPCEVIYARQGRGHELLRAAWRAASPEGGVTVVEEWE